MDRTTARWMIGGAAAAGILALRRTLRGMRVEDLAGHVALITGGTRGLGLLLARALVQAGCTVSLCARNAAELSRAEDELRGLGGEVLAFRCDVSQRADVEAFVRATEDRFGRVDICVNNAGIIQVGPLEAMTLADFEEAMAVMFWGVVYPTLAVLPGMRARRHGHIVTITSIGGKVAVPRLLPYTAAKFAAVGFSQGLRAELAGSGVRVTTVVPGLMRTGSFLHARFAGRPADEYTWFSLGASLPVLSMDAGRAARRIVEAIRRGESEVILTFPAEVAVRLHGLLPGQTADVLGAVHRWVLPSGSADARRVEPGWRVQETRRRPLLDVLTTLGRAAARRYQRRATPPAAPPPLTPPAASPP